MNQPAGSRAVDPARLNGALADGLGRGNIDTELLNGDCQARDCWIELARSRGRTHVVVPTLEQRGPDQYIRIEFVDASTGAVIVATDEVCEICGEDELVTTVADAAAELIPRLQRLEAEPARLVIGGEPEGATVEIDGEKVGTLPWEGEVEAGEHEMRISKEGYVSLTRSITASPGVQEMIGLSLQVAPQTDPVERPVDRRRVGLASGLIAGGAVGVGAGAGLFVLDGRPYERDCGPEVVDVNGRCPRMYESTGFAVAAVVVGGAALVGGVVLLVHTLRRRGRAPARVGLVPRRRGAALSIRF